MKRTFPFVITICAFLLVQCSVDRLIIKSESGKYKIKATHTIAVTEKGKVYPFNEACKSLCKECDPLLANVRWKIDSLYSDRIVLKNELTFLLDTITQQEFRTLSHIERKKDFLRLISIGKKPYYVYKIPEDIEYQTFYFDSLGWITYSYKDECYHSGPLQRIFANPNKIRRINMEAARIKVKYAN